MSDYPWTGLMDQVRYIFGISAPFLNKVKRKIISKYQQHITVKAKRKNESTNTTLTLGQYAFCNTFLIKY